MKLKNLTNVLFVKDIELAKDFYTNILKQQIALDFGTNVLYKPGFALWQIRDTHIIPSTLGVEKTQDRTVNRSELCFETENIEAVFEDLKKQNVVFLHELTEEIWGQYTIRFFDPDHHLIEIGESLEQFVLRFYNQGMSVEQVSKRTHVPVHDVQNIIDGELKIEPAELVDLPEILKLQKACFLTEAIMYDDYSITPLNENLVDINKSFKDTLIFKGVIKGKIVASVRASVSGQTCFIGRLVVDQDYQNRGIGMEMMRFVENAFQNCERYELFTGEKSQKNLYLYNKLGYKEFKAEPVSDKVTFKFMEKKRRLS